MTFKVPADATVSGSCSEGDANTQEITLSFFEGWSFAVQMKKPEETALLRTCDGRFCRSLLADESTYSWTMLKLTYVVDSTRFLDPDPAGIVLLLK